MALSALLRLLVRWCSVCGLRSLVISVHRMTPISEGPAPCRTILLTLVGSRLWTVPILCMILLHP